MTRTPREGATFTDAFRRTPLMAILRGFDTARTLEICEQSWQLGIHMVEVPIQSSAAVDTLAAAAKGALARSAFVGAGTVTTVERVEAAAAAGAAFTVAPGLDVTVAEASLAAGMPHLPGVATATDIQNAQSLGLNWLKAFPASNLGADWFGAMHGPFPEVHFVATGGMGITNAEEYLRAGAAAISLGSALADPEQLSQVPALIKRLKNKDAQ